MDRTKAERDLLVGTISDLRDSIEELENRIEYMSDELKERKARLETWRRRLVALDGGFSGGERRRKPKGENLRAVITCLQSVITGLAAGEIQRRTEMPWSSIQATLKRNPTIFVEANGLWKLKKQPDQAAILRRVDDGGHADAGYSLAELVEGRNSDVEEDNEEE